MPYPPGTKLVCIDATPIPILAWSGLSVLDFTFPHGFLQEGTTYCVERATQNNDGSYGLRLTGLPILCQGHESNWHHLRFRKLDAQKYQKSQSAHQPFTATQISLQLQLQLQLESTLK